MRRIRVVEVAALSTLVLALSSEARAADTPEQTRTAPAAAPPPADHTSKDAAAAAPGMTPVPAPTPAEVKYRRVSVDVATSQPDAIVERRVTHEEGTGAFLIFPWRSSKSTWEQVCVAPCRGADLDRYSTYRIAEANGIAASHPFTLPQGSDAVSLRLDAGNRLAHHVGIGLSGLGLAALIVGGSLFVVAANTSHHDDQDHARTAGYITGGAGIVALAVGIPLAILTQTRVFVDDKPLRAAGNKPRLTGNGFVF